MGGGAPITPPPSRGAPVSYPEPQQVSPHILFQAPLSRRGHGPGLILVLDHYAQLTESEGNGDLPPLRKWAEEGFAVVQLLIPCNVDDGGEFPLQKALNILKSSSTCDFGNGVGLVSYISRLPFYIEESICLTPQIKALVSYGGRKISTLNESATSIPPQLIHIAGPDRPRRQSMSLAPELPAGTILPSGTLQSYRYEDAAQDSGWMLPGDEAFHAQSSSFAHLRSLAFVKGLLKGPLVSIEEIWDEFCRAVYLEQDVENIMAMMVQNPRVRYIPTNVTASGTTSISKFYTSTFLPSFAALPSDNKTGSKLPLTNTGITTGPSHLIDQSTIHLDSTTNLPWLLPDIDRTLPNVEVKVDTTTTVMFRGDRIVEQKVTWDQADVWRQVGLVPEWVKLKEEGVEMETGKKERSWKEKLMPSEVERRENIDDVEVEGC